MAFKFFILAGEASGDAHASRLIEALKALEPSAKFVGMGGPKMAAAGLEVAKDLDGMQVIGFWEVAKKFGFFRDVFHKLLDRLKQEKPDALICVDYPGFNLRFAKEVKKLGIPVLYYIVPQVWAWKPNRPKAMAQYVDRAFCIFEFEPPFFEKFGLKTEFVGHPLVDKRGTMNDDCGIKLPSGPKTVAFLPGSRESEVRQHGYQMCKGFHLASKKQPSLRALMSFPDGVSYKTKIKLWMWLMTWWQPFTFPVNEWARENWPSEKMEFPRVWAGPQSEAEKCYDILRDAPSQSHSSLLPTLADFSVVKSGTSTLEAGLVGKPMCVGYKAGAISYPIARLLVNIPVFSLVNIVLGRYVVPEILQSDFTPARIAAEIERGLNDEKYREQQKAALAELPKKLGGPGASARTAKSMLDFLKGRG